ncbi:ATP-dependent nuclease [Kushneria sp. TE3]|uniref:ATP-dependent nuclease n=1 Tax=Kushneria sp. TE3 TaxID=3449832 RepID=UPI003F688F95
MKIKNIEISNWRSIKNLKASFEDLVVLIGQNNHGKSNVLSSLLFFFGEIKHQELDFNCESEILYVEILFSELDVKDQVTFKKYLDVNNNIRVRKTAYKEGSFEYRGYVSSPVEECLREENAGRYKKRSDAEGLPFYDFLPLEGRITKDIVAKAQNEYCLNNEVEFSYELQDSDFLGQKSVAKGIFGEVYFIPAIREASADFSTKDTSTFGKLYSLLIESISDENDEWKKAKDNIGDLFSALNKTNKEGGLNQNRPKELADFESQIGRELQGWGAELNLEVSPPSIEDVFKANTQVWVDDGVRTDIRRKGHGLQRALTFALIKVIAARHHASKISSDRARSTSNSNFFILEEPELYLHPQAQRALLETLRKLSETDFQVFVCTHSSSLVDIERYSSIGIVRKSNSDEGTSICQCSSELFPGDEKKLFNLAYWINPDRGELFFSSKVILLEGQTEKMILPLVARQLDVFDHGVTLIDCAAKTSMHLYMKLLNHFSINYVVVYDKDHHAQKNQQQKDAADRVTNNILRELDGDLGKSVELVNDFEEELGFQAGASSKPYEALLRVSEAVYVIPDNFKYKVRSIYEV